MEVRGEYESYPKREYVGSRVLTKETCADMTSTYKTFDFPGQHANLDSFFWSYKIPWWFAYIWELPELQLQLHDAVIPGYNWVQIAQEMILKMNSLGDGWSA